MRTGRMPAAPRGGSLDTPRSSRGRSLGVVPFGSSSPRVHAIHRGEFEIRPGVWAYEDRVPLEVLWRHLEGRGMPTSR